MVDQVLDPHQLQGPVRGQVEEHLGPAVVDVEVAGQFVTVEVDSHGSFVGVLDTGAEGDVAVGERFRDVGVPAGRVPRLLEL